MTDENPYAAPQTQAFAPVVAIEDDNALLRLAQAHRGVRHILLISAVAIVCAVVVFGFQLSASAGNVRSMEIVMLFSYCVLMSGVAQAVAAYYLLKELRRSRFDYCALTLCSSLPLIGLVVMANYDRQAVARLRSHDVALGFLGAPGSELKRLRALSVGTHEQT